MFYAQPNAQQMPRPGFVYPQQMMPRGPRGPMPPPGRGVPPAYQMPAYAMPLQRQQQRPRRQNGPGGRGGGMQRMTPQQRNFRYTSNARNQPGPGQEGMMPMQQVPQQAPPPKPEMEPLTPAALAAATPEQQKNMIGERLYPLIHGAQPEL